MLLFNSVILSDICLMFRLFIHHLDNLLVSIFCFVDFASLEIIAVCWGFLLDLYVLIESRDDLNSIVSAYASLLLRGLYVH
jgi:hypothetical protein